MIKNIHQIEGMIFSCGYILFGIIKRICDDRCKNHRFLSQNKNESLKLDSGYTFFSFNYNFFSIKFLNIKISSPRIESKFSNTFYIA